MGQGTGASSLHESATQNDMRQKVVLIFSLEPWGDMWYSKQHYAWELAKHHQVFFISPPRSWKLSDLFSDKLKLTRITSGLTVVQYSNRLPLRILPEVVATQLRRATAKRLARLLQPTENLLWCFYPEALALQPVLHTAQTRLIYHVVDPYQTFTDDIPLAKAADLVIAINPWFQQHYRQWNRHTILIPHGVRARDREQDPTAIASYREQWHPYVILAGGLNKHVNYTLLKYLAEQIPELTLVLAGERLPAAGPDQADLFALQNVVHAGVFPPEKLRGLIGGAVAGLIAYEFQPRRAQPERAGRTPLKAISYLAQMKPVVTSINCYIPELDEKGVFKADTPDEFIGRIRQIIDGRIKLNEAATEAYLNGILYPELIQEIFSNLSWDEPVGSSA